MNQPLSWLDTLCIMVTETAQLQNVRFKSDQTDVYSGWQTSLHGARVLYPLWAFFLHGRRLIFRDNQ